MIAICNLLIDHVQKMEFNMGRLISFIITHL